MASAACSPDKAAGRSTGSADGAGVGTTSATALAARAPFLLVLNETYNPLWRASYPGGVAAPVAIGATQMGFLIPHTGDFEFRIEFVPQAAHDLGLGVALAALVLVLAALVWPAARRLRAHAHRA